MSAVDTMEVDEPIQTSSEERDDDLKLPIDVAAIPSKQQMNLSEKEKRNNLKEEMAKKNESIVALEDQIKTLMADKEKYEAKLFVLKQVSAGISSL